MRGLLIALSLVGCRGFYDDENADGTCPIDRALTEADLPCDCGTATADALFDCGETFCFDQENEVGCPDSGS